MSMYVVCIYAFDKMYENPRVRVTAELIKLDLLSARAVCTERNLNCLLERYFVVVVVVVGSSSGVTGSARSDCLNFFFPVDRSSLVVIRKAQKLLSAE